MDELIKILSSGSVAGLIISAAVVIFLFSLLAIYVVAFWQGRSISFWPPSIGERPRAFTDETMHVNEKESSDKFRSEGFQSPVVDRGTVLHSSASKAYRITSGYYGGATATLYKAEDQNGNTVIAKMYWRGLAPNSPPWDLFQREQRAAEILTHRNIVATLDRGLRSGYPFTIIEYLGGGTLRDWLRTHDRLPGPEIFSVFSQLADAIDYAHSRGVIHLDVKPGNVLFESDPNSRVALSDFGIASILGAVEREITAIGGEFSGTPGYIAPELIEGNTPTPQADIYSLGIVLFEMIAKVTPFDRNKDALAIMRAKLDHDAPDIRTLRADVPSEIAVRLADVLGRSPSSRPRTARAVVSGIEEQLRSL